MLYRGPISIDASTPNKAAVASLGE